MNIQAGQSLKENNRKFWDECEILGKKANSSIYTHIRQITNLTPMLLQPKKAQGELHNTTYTNSLCSKEKHFNQTPKRRKKIHKSIITRSF